MIIKQKNSFRRKHKQNILIKGTKGKGTRFKPCNQGYIKSQSNAYKDRKLQKRFYKTLWLSRINGFFNTRLNWSLFHSFFLRKNIYINSKICSFLALHDIYCFQQIILKNLHLKLFILEKDRKR